MSRAGALIGSAVFLVLAPGSVAGLIPWLVTRWRPPPQGFQLPGAVLGGALILGGGLVLLEAFARFALEGRGTPAPPAPTQRLVVKGVYRWTRNPMYVAVLAMILGQALVFQSPRLAVYGAAVWLAFHVFVVAFEEPRLRRAFGADYDAYRRHVPRWRPRLRPWRPADDR